MLTRRHFVLSATAAGAATALAGCAAPSNNTGAPLHWKHFPAGEKGFFRAPVLLSGDKEAMLIDGGFALPDGRAHRGRSDPTAP